MKKTILFLFVITIFTLNLKAQESSRSLNANINVSAEIISSIELITINTLTFRNTSESQQQLRVDPVSDNNAGFMIAVGSPGSAFRLEYIANRRLERRGGNGFLIFRYSLSANDIEEQSTSELVLNNEQSFNFNAEGRFYFWVGGEVNLANATPGNYEGDFTIEIDYI